VPCHSTVDFCESISATIHVAFIFTNLILEKLLHGHHLFAVALPVEAHGDGRLTLPSQFHLVFLILATQLLARFSRSLLWPVVAIISTIDSNWFAIAIVICLLLLSPSASAIVVVVVVIVAIVIMTKCLLIWYRRSCHSHPNVLGQQCVCIDTAQNPLEASIEDGVRAETFLVLVISQTKREDGNQS